MQGRFLIAIMLFFYCDSAFPYACAPSDPNDPNSVGSIQGEDEAAFLALREVIEKSGDKKFAVVVESPRRGNVTEAIVDRLKKSFLSTPGTEIKVLKDDLKVSWRGLVVSGFCWKKRRNEGAYFYGAVTSWTDKEFKERFDFTAKEADGHWNVKFRESYKQSPKPNRVPPPPPPRKKKIRSGP